MAEKIRARTRVDFIGTSPEFERMLGAGGSLPSISGRCILALRAGALGDTLLALPSIGALRSLVGPSGEVDFVGTEPSVRLALGPRLATRVHSTDRARFLPLFQESADDTVLLSFLRGFALVVAWSNLPLLAEKLSRLGIPLLHASPHPPAGVHASDHLYRSLSPLGVLGRAPPPEIDLDEDSRLAALDFLRRNALHPSDFVALHPSSGSPRKNWPARRFQELALRLRRENRRFAWIEGEADRKVVASLVNLVEAPVARDLPLPVLASLLSLSRGFVGNDSGITHLAAAVKARTIALFGPTDPSVWAPRGPSVLVLAHGSNAETVWEKARSLFYTR
jgi:ADP-heptose:LPS heptosyltransferase